MVCTGAKSERQARKAVLKVIDELKRDGIVILGKPDITIQNIVASAGLGGLNAPTKANYGMQKMMHDTGQVPGLTYSIDETTAVSPLLPRVAGVWTRAKRWEPTWIR